MPNLLLVIWLSLVAVVTSSLSVVDTVATTNSYGIKVFGSTLFVADGGTFKVIDATDPSDMSVVGTLPLAGDSRDVLLGPNPSQFVYVVALGTTGGLHKIDVSNPAVPSLVTTLMTPGNAQMGTTSGDYAFVADFFEGVQVISLSTMTIVSNAAVPDASIDVTIHQGYAYVSTLVGVAIVDIGDITAPSLVSTYSPTGSSLLVKFCAISPAGILFILTHNVIYVSDVSMTPTAPVAIKQFSAVTATRLTLHANRGYLADWSGGMRVIEDITDPSNVQITDTISLGWFVSEAQVGNGHVFIADAWGTVISVVDSTLSPSEPVVTTGSATWPSTPFNNQPVAVGPFDVVSFPSFLDGAVGAGVHFASGYPLPDNTEISLHCYHPTGCDFFISVYTCPGCSASNGGLPATLLTSQWQSGSCSPTFQPTGSSSSYSMTTFFNHIPQGTTTFYTNGQTDYLVIVALNGALTTPGSWCFKQHGPAISGMGCAANCPPSL